MYMTHARVCGNNLFPADQMGLASLENPVDVADSIRGLYFCDEHASTCYTIDGLLCNNELFAGERAITNHRELAKAPVMTLWWTLVDECWHNEDVKDRYIIYKR